MLVQIKINSGYMCLREIKSMPKIGEVITLESYLGKEDTIVVEEIKPTPLGPMIIGQTVNI